MERTLKQLEQQQISSTELKFKKQWVNQLRDAFFMEIADSYIQIASLLQNEDDKDDEAFNKQMDVIHDYQEKYTKLASKDRKQAEEYYQVWQTEDGIPGWIKSLLWTVFLSGCCIVYTMKKRSMYCFKKKEEEEDSDDEFH